MERRRITSGMTNNTTYRAFGLKFTALYRTPLNRDISIHWPIIRLIITRSPTDKSTYPRAASRNNLRIGQMTIIKFDCRHTIYIADKCANTLIASSIVNLNTIQGKIFDNNS